MIRQAISSMLRDHSKSRQVRFGQVYQELTKIATVFDERTFCRWLIGTVNIATIFCDDIDGWAEEHRMQRIITNDRNSKIGTDELSRKWNIGLQNAKDKLAATTQHGVHTTVHPISRRLQVDQLHLHRPLLRGKWYADTLLYKVNSIRGNNYSNVFTQGNFTKVVPTTARSDAGQLLVDFTDDVGIPKRLVIDDAREFTGKGKHFAKEARRILMQLHKIEQGLKNQNHAAEREIGFLANRWKLQMQKKRVPKRLWDFGLVVESEILTRMARGQDRRTGYDEVPGKTADISECLDFEFYYLVYWYDRPNKLYVSNNVRRLSRWLGISHPVGSNMCYWLITESGKLI